MSEPGGPPFSPVLRDLVGLVGLRQADDAARERSAAQWRALLACARRHRVGALLAAGIARTGAPIPPEHADFLRRLRQSQHARMRRSERALAELALQFAAADLPFALLKGIAVGQLYYDEPLDRRAVDIDILAPSERADAFEILRELGYRPTGAAQGLARFPSPDFRRAHADCEMLRESDGSKVELHWRLSRNRYFPPWHAEFLLGRTQPMTLAHARIAVPILAPPPLLVHLACHGARHLWFRLKWLCDIDRALARTSESEFAEAAALAKAAGCARAFHTSLALARKVFASPLPHAFDPDAVHRPILQAMLRAIADDDTVGSQTFAATVKSQLARLRLRSGLPYRIEMLRHAANGLMRRVARA